jgi:glycine/D-amino acid oxidase-like deaminating enzyme
MQIDLELKYPLHLRRYGNGRVVIVDSGWAEVGESANFDHAYEIVRLANLAYRLVSDLSQKRPHEYPARSPRNLGLSETGSGIPDPTETDGPGDRDRAEKAIRSDRPDSEPDHPTGIANDPGLGRELKSG